MKVLAINGSSRKNSNTGILITALLMVFVFAACGRSEEADMQDASVAYEATNDQISVDIPVNGETEKETPEDKKPEEVQGQESDNAGEDKEVGRFDFEKKEVMLNSGYEMPILGLGTYSLDHDTCVNSVKTLLQNGGRLIDTAYMYGNEEYQGCKRKEDPKTVGSRFCCKRGR